MYAMDVRNGCTQCMYVMYIMYVRKEELRKWVSLVDLYAISLLRVRNVPQTLRLEQTCLNMLATSSYQL